MKSSKVSPELIQAASKLNLTSSRSIDSVNRPSFTARREHQECCTCGLKRKPELRSRASKHVRSAAPRQDLFIARLSLVLLKLTDQE